MVPTTGQGAISAYGKINLGITITSISYHSQTFFIRQIEMKQKLF